jgi:triacylglycerol lipase
MWKIAGLVCALAAANAPARGADTVVLLHGLGRGPASMWPLAAALRQEGYRVINRSYPSQRGSVPELAECALGPVFGEDSGSAASPGRVHIVTHSLGGILVRRYLLDHGVPASFGRVVMLAPPNQGSEIVDALAGWKLYARVNGPAGLDLGTAPGHAPSRLGPLPPGVEAGVIAGDFSWNPLFSALIPGADDGKVAVARTHVAGETDHLVLPYSHTWLMNRAETRRQVLAFLRGGRFAPAGRSVAVSLGGG